MREWTLERLKHPDGTTYDMIKTPDQTVIFVPVFGPPDDDRAAFIVRACNDAEARLRRYEEGA